VLSLQLAVQIAWTLFALPNLFLVFHIPPKTPCFPPLFVEVVVLLLGIRKSNAW